MLNINNYINIAAILSAYLSFYYKDTLGYVVIIYKAIFYLLLLNCPL